MATSIDTAATEPEHARGFFTSRRVFILAAIGSAVGLGNIWRFPYVAYDNGGGAFIIPYLIALLTAGLPFLFLDYAIGNRFRGSAPLSFRRMGGRKAEAIGWWQVLVSCVIGVYYAAIIAWAVMYTGFSVNKSWGEDTGGFLIGEFLQVADEPGVGFDFVAGLTIPLIIVWLVILGIMLLGVQKGVGATAVIFIPILIVMFTILVVRGLLLPGALDGLNTLFRPDWGALAEPGVWLAAFGQIFFSLSIGFGVMITYSSYISRKTDLTGSGSVVGLSNSSFEVLAGIGVFSVLGFLAQANNVPVEETAADGLGLAFIAYPAIINEAPGGSLIGVLFFGSLVAAGITSLVSVLEVVVPAVREKLGLTRRTATLLVLVPMASVSVIFFGTTTGLPVLDTVDHFINRFGILAVAVVNVVVVMWVLRASPVLRRHVNRFATIKLGTWWVVLIGVVTPVLLTIMLVLDFIRVVREGYEGYPGWLLGVFGWGICAGVVMLAAVLTLTPWSRRTDLNPPPEGADVGDHPAAEGALR